MVNLLIRGCPGTGKTLLARAAAYYMCSENKQPDEIWNQDIVSDLSQIESFISSSEKVEYIQVHPSMDYDDIVYGLKISAAGSLTISYAEKRIMTLCNKAKANEGQFAIILDDINRANAGALLGNLLYAMEYRNQTVDLPNGNCISIPDNVIIIITENTLDVSNELDFAVRRRMTYLKELTSDRDAVRRYYQSCIHSSGLHLILDTYDRVRDFIQSYFVSGTNVSYLDYIPGHGMYMVNRIGNDYSILDNVRLKIIYQVCPFLKNLYSMGMLKINPESFVEQIQNAINSGIDGLCPITSIKKKLVKANSMVSPFSLSDSRDYYANVILPNGCKDYRGMMECVIDALVLNGVFPYDLLLDNLLQNTSLAYIESLKAPFEKAAYLIEKNKAPHFLYETVRNGRVSGTHAYYTLDGAATGRWSKHDDTEEYIVVKKDEYHEHEYILLSGFRNHGFNPESAELGVQHNTVNIMTAIHILLNEYYKQYISSISLIQESDDSYHDLYRLLLLEYKYLESVKQMLKGRSADAPKGDDARLEYYGSKISNLRLLWHGINERIEVDADKFENLCTNTASLTIDTYEDMFICSGRTKQITVKGVLKMVNLKDYQSIMDNIGVRQMIFQGPPGTSKTFTSKRFVLTQLKPDAASLSKASASQEDISRDLDQFKLTDSDYSDPKNSSKLQTGGWDLVQFHPSYSYEDFIRGIEVKIPHGSTTPSYESVNRILGKIAEFSRIATETGSSGNNPKFYLIIDEINRANLATVFGELIYGLEYRNSRVSTPYEVQLRSSDGVTKDIIIGKNLYIIGTMNTADKSIDAIDYAIRRRFIFIDSPADRDVIVKCYQNISGNNDDKSIELVLFDAVQQLFDSERFFNDEYQKSDVRIGHTYFLRDRKNGYIDATIEHFIFQVIPILREYVKDGILSSSENLIPLEHTAREIAETSSGAEQIRMISENIMLYISQFGSYNKSNAIINNDYIGRFIDELRNALCY